MPLPTYPRERPVWIEVTKADHEHGGDGWEFGTCLWSPSTAKPQTGKTAGSDIYRPMREVQRGDLILHFYHNSWERTGSPHFRLCGYSYAAASFQEVSTEPPKAGEWAGRNSYYRIELAGFTELENALSVPELIARHADVIKKEKASGAPKHYPFAEYRDGLRLAQGTYLATCTASLYGLMTEALGQVDRPEVRTAAGQQQEFVEGTRRKREAYFFARNPALVREAKQHYGYRCMVCQFDFEERYGDLGHEYVECHHLNPLSERRGKEEDKALTKLEDVAVLCANCHRMVHKRRPALSLEELRAHLREQSMMSN